jgi:hypothetical protein
MVVKHPDGTTSVLYVRLPSWLKNQIVEHCNTEGVSVTSWVANVLNRAVEDQLGIPPSPRGRAPVPTKTEVLRGYLTGEDVLEPCGKIAPCERTGVVEIAGVEYCNHCNIRIN